jgi:uncharacterized protein
MKMRLSPVQINLKELPAEGREFDFTNETGELTPVLKDLIGSNPYQVHFRIVPQGNSFDLQGRLSAGMDLQCSRCAEDFKFPVNSRLHELIVIEKALGLGDQMSKANHAHELESEGPGYMVLESDIFEVGEYVHEMIGLAEPMRPLCAPETPEGCAHHDQKVERTWLSYDQERKPGTDLRAKPFQVLEKLKLKS